MSNNIENYVPYAKFIKKKLPNNQFKKEINNNAIYIRRQEISDNPLYEINKEEKLYSNKGNNIPLNFDLKKRKKSTSQNSFNHENLLTNNSISAIEVQQIPDENSIFLQSNEKKLLESIINLDNKKDEKKYLKQENFIQNCFDIYKKKIRPKNNPQSNLSDYLYKKRANSEYDIQKKGFAENSPQNSFQHNNCKEIICKLQKKDQNQRYQVTVLKKKNDDLKAENTELLKKIKKIDEQQKNVFYFFLFLFKYFY